MVKKKQWHDITPKDEIFSKRPSFKGSTKISVMNKTLLVLAIPAFRSKDGGQTWTILEVKWTCIHQIEYQLVKEREYIL